MIGKDRHPNGLRMGVLIDYDYALDLAPEDRINKASPSSPHIWPRRNRRVLAKLRYLPRKKKIMQKVIINKDAEGKRIRGHRTVSFFFRYQWHQFDNIRGPCHLWLMKFCCLNPHSTGLITTWNLCFTCFFICVFSTRAHETRSNLLALSLDFSIIGCILRSIQMKT